MAVEWLTFHITDRCQLDCQHCLRDPSKKPKDLSLALLTKVLDEGKRVHGATHAAFTGGEPTLHPEFCAIVDAAIERGFTWHMVSNGRTVPWLFERFREKPSRKAAMTSITLSLDGADEETHDAIRGKGSFREVMTAAMICTAHGVKFVLQAALHAKNVHQIEALGMLAAELDASRLSFSMVQPTGTHHDEALYLPVRSWRMVMDRIDRLANTLRLPVSHPEGYYHKQPLYVCQPFAQQQLHVTVEGELSLCCQHAGVPTDASAHSSTAGDLNEVSLVQAHRSLITMIHDAQLRKLDAAAAGTLDNEWDRFPCNYCLKDFGKPHWTNEGTDGPAAQRERWRGAWNPRRLPIVQR